MRAIVYEDNFKVEEHIINGLNKPITKDQKNQMFKLSDKIFYGEKLHVLDIKNIVDLFAFNLLCYYRKEVTLANEQNITIYELTDNDRSNCAIELYLELKKAGQIKIN